MAAFSFYPSKNLGAMGDAGAFVTSSEALARHVRSLRQHGEVEKYRSEYPGYTARLDTIQGSVLLRKLPHLAGWNGQRAAAAERYSAELAGVGDLRLPPVAQGSSPVWHLYVIRTAEPLRLAAFLGERGISTARHYPELPHLSAAYADLGLARGAFPVAEALAAEGLSLPIFPGISESQLEHVCESVRAYFARGCSRPRNDAPHRLLSDVAFGEDVVVQPFVNLYGCRIGDGTRIGPFVEIQRDVEIGARCKIRVTPSSARAW